MQDDDPFSSTGPGDIERTVILPSPGGRRRVEADPLAQTAVSMPPTEAALVGDGGVGRNPLLRAAATGFALVRRLRGLPRHDDVPALRNSVVAMMHAFEETARDQGARREAAYAGRYALCALIDETVLQMPWGSDSVWSKQSLLTTLHNETGGGAKFFQILARMLEDPAGNIDLLELLHVCLCLGFRGQYGLMEGGGERLAEIQRRLYRSIREQRGDGDDDLSPHWRGVQDRGPAVARFVPLWVVPVAVAALAVVVYLGFSYGLNRSSDDVFAALGQLGRMAPKPEGARAAPRLQPKPAVVTVAPAAPRPAERYRAALAEEVDRGLVDIADLGNATRIVVHNRGLFASGSARVAAGHRPLIEKIGAALTDEPGPILVAGHTDSQPIRTLKFPSNWHLSSARAKSVLAILSQSVRGNLQSEGRSDAEPVASNATAQGREQNRRIEILVPVR